MTTPDPASLRPRALGDAPVVTQRRGLIHAQHVAPLNALVEEMRKERGPGAAIPSFDPADGGTDAQILLLLEAPGPQAAPLDHRTSSGFVSLDNDDRTAQNLHELVHAAGLDRSSLVIWNIVPWYLGDEAQQRIRAATQADTEEAAPWLDRLLALLPEVEVAVLLGRRAQLGWLNATAAAVRPLPVLACPHPSPRALAGRPERRTRIREILAAAAEFVLQR